MKALPGRHAVEDLDAADFNQPIAAERIKAGSFCIENNFAHGIKRPTDVGRIRIVPASF